MDHLDLHSIDADGAIAETHAAARRQLTPVTLAATSCARVRWPAVPQCPAARFSVHCCRAPRWPRARALRPRRRFGKGDIGILNYALTLEYLESAFYNAAAKNNIAKGDKQLTAFLKTAIRRTRTPTSSSSRPG